MKSATALAETFAPPIPPASTLPETPAAIQMQSAVSDALAFRHGRVNLNEVSGRVRDVPICAKDQEWGNIMFRMGLLTSTAMTAVALLLAGAPTGAYAQTDMHIASRDPNTRFLCTYGQFAVSAYSSSDLDSASFASGWTHVAVPVTGHGQRVRRIRVVESQGRFTGTSAFSVGIYSNTASGYPGKLIAGGTGNVGSTCGPVTIAIPPTRLKSNTKYWVEETIAAIPNSAAVRYWQADPTANRRAYVQIRRYTVCSSGSNCSSVNSTTPWMKQTMGPYLKLR